MQLSTYCIDIAITLGNNSFNRRNGNRNKAMFDYIKRQEHNDALWQDGSTDALERHEPDDYEDMPH